MDKLTTESRGRSRIIWENLEEWVRGQVQEFIQTILDEEVTDLLGRQKSERRQGVDSPPAYHNGHGKERKLTLNCGTIEVRRPRVRGLEKRFPASASLLHLSIVHLIGGEIGAMDYQINHIHLKSPEPDKTAEWYIKNFGATITHVGRSADGGYSVWLDFKGFRVSVTGPAAGQTLPQGSVEPHFGLEHFGFDTGDIHADLSRLKSAGAKILQPVTKSETGRQFACIEGPDNVRIELVQPAG